MRPPCGGPIAEAGAQLIQTPHGRLAARQSHQEIWHGGEIQPRHHAVIAVFDQEATGLRREAPDQIQFVLGQAEAGAQSGSSCCARGLGMKIWVAACSMIAEAMRLSSASRAD